MHAARFTVICPECVRMEFSPSGCFTDEPSLLVPRRPSTLPPDGAGLVVAGHGASGTIDTGIIRVEYRHTAAGFTPESLSATITHRSSAVPITWRPGLCQAGNLGGTLRTLDGLRRHAAVPPGLIATDGWTLIDDSAGHIIRDGWVALRPEGRGTDWYLLGYGREYRAALRAFVAMAGPVPMPRAALLGAWYSRFWPYSSADYREIALEFSRRGFPLDVLVLDMDWHRPPPPGGGDPWTGWSWNRELLPDAEELLAFLHERSITVTLNLHPADGVRPHEDAYAPFMRQLGHDPASREVVPFDAASRSYARALFDSVHAPLDGAGVDFWWLDWQQAEHTRSIPDLSNTAWLNRLYFDHTGGSGSAAPILEPPPSQRGRRGVSFSRWAGPGAGGSGDHRHPVHFSGDAEGSWPVLRYLVPFTAAAGNAGCFYWSHDVGGHFGEPDDELFTRWVQFAALSASVRLHSARSARLDRRPWLAGPPFSDAARSAFSLRAQLMPSVYTAARQSHELAVPLLRPMYLDHHGSPESFRVPGQYMLGDDLLAAPITSPGLGPARVALQTVWFPPGGPGAPRCRWYHWFSSERYEGGCCAVVGATIDEVPLFARGGAPIFAAPPLPAPDADGNTGRSGGGGAAPPLHTFPPHDRLDIHLFPGLPGTRHEETLYEDDGLSREHESGGYATTRISAAWDESEGALLLRLTVHPTLGAFSGQAPRRRIRVLLRAARAVGDVLVGAASGAARMEPDARLGTIEIAEHDIRRPLSLTARVVELDHTAHDAGRRLARLAAARGGAEQPSSDPVGEVVRLLGEGGAPAGADAAALIAIATGVALRADDRPVAPEGSAAFEPPSLRLFDPHGLVAAPGADVLFIDSRAGERRPLAPQVAVHPSPTVPGVIAPPLPTPEPPLGVRATTLARVELRLGQNPVAFEAALVSRLRPLSAWRVVGPFPFDPRAGIAAAVHQPESGSAGCEPAERYPGVGGVHVGWTPAQAGPDWAVDLRRSFNGGHRLGYAVTFVWSPMAQTAEWRIDSGDRLEAWCNGAKVASVDHGDSMASARAAVPIELCAGWNRLLVKVTEGGGGFGFTSTIEARTELREAPVPS